MIRELVRPLCRAAVIGLAAFASLTALAARAEARVTRIVIDEKQSPAYGGTSFGGAGPYERITGHAFGPASPEMARDIAAIDASIGRLLQELQARGLRDRVNLVIVSDACTSPEGDNHDQLMRRVFPRMARVRTTAQVVAMWA